MAANDAQVSTTVLPLIRDADGDFARQYRTSGSSVFLVRPDGYLGYGQIGSVDPAGLVEALRTIFV